MLSNVAVSVPVVRLGMYCPCSDMWKWLNFPSSGFWEEKNPEAPSHYTIRAGA